MTIWERTLKIRQRKLKRAVQQVRSHVKAGRFLFGKSSAMAHQSPSTPTKADTTSTTCSTDRSLAARGTATLRYLAPRGRENLTRQARVMRPREKHNQLGAAGWDLRCGTWLPAAQGTPYSTSRSGGSFLCRTAPGHLLNGVPLATRGLEEIGRKPSSLQQGRGI